MEGKFIKYLVSAIVLFIATYIFSERIILILDDIPTYKKNVEELYELAPNVNLKGLIIVGSLAFQMLTVIIYVIGLKIVMDLCDDEEETVNIVFSITLALSISLILFSFKPVNYTDIEMIILNQIIFSIIFATLTFLIFKNVFKKVYRKSILILFSLYTFVNIVITIFTI